MEGVGVSVRVSDAPPTAAAERDQRAKAGLHVGYEKICPIQPVPTLPGSGNAQTSSDIAVTLVGATCALRTRTEKQDATSFDAAGTNPSSELSAEPGHHQNEMWCRKVPETVVLVPGPSL